MKLRRRHRLDELQAGLPVEVEVSEAAELQAELLVAGRQAKRLKLSRRARTMRLALGTREVGEAGRTFVFARFERATLRRLARVKQVRARVRITARDAAGQVTEVVRGVEVRS